MHILMRYDEKVLRFDMYTDMMDNLHPRKFVAKIEETFADTERLKPVNLVLSDEGLTTWLSKRTIPKNRANVNAFLSLLHIDERDRVGILNISNGLSLNDSYWVWNEANGEPFKFDEINLYDNEFSDIIAVMAFTGEGSKSNPELLGSTPEYTTGGMLAKAWRKINGNIYLYKTGTSGFVNAGFEPYSEYLAVEVANQMGLRATMYSLEMWKDKLCSVCPLFTSKDVSFVNAGSMVSHGGMPAVLDYYKELGNSFYQQLVSQMVFDGVIANQDRHFGNFGLLINSDNKIFDTAPLFDHGLSLFAYAHGEDWDDLDSYIKEHIPAGYDNYIDFVLPYISDTQIDQLKRLDGFEFSQHNEFTLPDWRIEKLNAFVQGQVSQFLKKVGA